MDLNKPEYTMPTYFFYTSVDDSSAACRGGACLYVYLYSALKPLQLQLLMYKKIFGVLFCGCFLEMTFPLAFQMLSALAFNFCLLCK